MIRFGKNATGQEDDNTTGFPLDYKYFNNYYKMIPLDLSKEKKNCLKNHLILIQKQYNKLILLKI